MGEMRRIESIIRIWKNSIFVEFEMGSSYVLIWNSCMGAACWRASLPALSFFCFPIVAASLSPAHRDCFETNGIQHARQNENLPTPFCLFSKPPTFKFFLLVRQFIATELEFEE
jgi:hypothetical protein